MNHNMNLSYYCFPGYINSYHGSLKHRIEKNSPWSFSHTHLEDLMPLTSMSEKFGIWCLLSSTG